MDHKILILGITIFVVILLLSFRKEKYENEEDIGEVEVPPGLNISEFLKKLELAKKEKKKNDETLDALYDTNRDENQDSREEATKAIEEEDEAQYAFLKDLIDRTQRDEDQIREDARNQIKGELEKTVTDQARDYFETKSTGFENIPKKKGIVKVDNVRFDSFAASLAAGVDISTYGGTNVYGTGEQFYSARVPYCHKRPKLVEGAHHIENCDNYSSFVTDPWPPHYVPDPAGAARCKRQKYLQKSEYSCLKKDGVPGDVGENGFEVDSFEECATKCLESDLCSGFSIVPDETFPEEGFGMTCKMTHHEFEDSIIQDAGKNEQVFAVHEDDKLKNPLYFHIMNNNYGGGTVNSGFLATHSMGTKGSDFHSNAATGSHCYWRSACDYYPYCYGSLGLNLQKFQKSACENGVVIQEDGIRRDCDGAWVGMKKGGDAGRDWIRIEDLETIDQRVRDHGNDPAVCSSRSYPYDGKEETFEIFFQKAPGGRPAVNGGICPSADKIEVPCGQERAPAPPANEPCEQGVTETFSSKYTNDSGNYCVRNGGGVTRDTTWTVTKAAVGDGKCAFGLKNVGDTKTISGRNVDGNPENYPECPAHLFKPCQKYEARGACENLSEGNCGKGTKKVSYVVSQQPGKYGSQCGTVGVYKTEDCEKPCNQGFCTAKTLNNEACPDSCKRDAWGQCCVNTVTISPSDPWGDNEDYEVCVPSRYGDNQKYTGRNSIGQGTYTSASLNDWYRDSACRGAYGGDSGDWMQTSDQFANPYTCHKSGGSSSIRTELDPFWDDLTSLRQWIDRPTKGWEGVLNYRNIDRASGPDGKESCETPGNYGYEALGISNPNHCTWFDIQNFGRSSEKKRRQFWYDEMNKD